MPSESAVASLDSRATSVAEEKGVYLTLALFCLGHFFVDLYSSGLGILQPLLRGRFHLTLTQAGLLGGVLVFSSSMMQPVYGYLSDRLRSRLFTVLAPATAGIFISSLGLAPGYWALLVMVALGGAGIASFHPQGAANATARIRNNKGRAMAIFVTAGTLGYSLGPTFFSFVCTTLGIDHSYWAAIPGILLTVLLLNLLRPSHIESRHRSKFDLAQIKAVWKPLAILYLLVVIRSVPQVTFGQFLPLYLNLERGYPLSHASYIVSMYLAGGAIGGFAGGNLADRFGGRMVILISMIASVPFLALFVFTKGIVSIVGLVIGGLILFSTIPVNVVMGQELAPSQAGTISAMMMGAAWGMAGIIFVPLTGWFSEMFSLHHALGILILFPVIGSLVALKLPK